MEEKIAYKKDDIRSVLRAMERLVIQGTENAKMLSFMHEVLSNQGYDIKEQKEEVIIIGLFHFM